MPNLLKTKGSYRFSGVRLAAEKMLRESDQCFRMLIESVSDCAIYTLDPFGRVTSWNSGARRIKGYEADEIIGKSFSKFYELDDIEAGQPKRTLSIALREGRYENESCWRVRKDGTRFQAHIVIEAVFDRSGTHLGFAKITRDITEKKRKEADTRVIQERIAAVFGSASVGLAQTDGEGRFMLVNDAFCSILGRSRQEMLCLSVKDVTHPEDMATSKIVIQRLLVTGRGGVIEKRYIRADGSVLDCRTSVSVAVGENGRPVQPITVTAVVENITDRKRAEEQIRHLAFHDHLTGLANRALMHERLVERIVAVSQLRRCAVLTLDLDRFKSVNDSFGHEIGDKLLQQVALRLRGAVRTDDVVARIGGDEFVILQFDAPQPSASAKLAQRIVELLAMPFKIGDRFIVVGTSIGIALGLKDGEGAFQLLRKSDAALYRAKKVGGGTFEFFAASFDQQMSERSELQRDLSLAIANEQLKLHFQPQFACASGALTGFEALLRWRHPTKGDIAPSTFIPIAEESGLIQPLGLWALNRACAEASIWPSPLRIAVNVSSAQLRAGISEPIAEILHRTGLAADRLELELTESVLLEHTEEALATLRALKSMGIRIALDDFGTGYSSLSYLRHFAFDRLKIDKSFVQSLGQEDAALSLVQAILSMACHLGIAVTAEGVETDQQLDLLRGERCGEVQGFLLGRPMAAEEVQRFIVPISTQDKLRFRDEITFGQGAATVKTIGRADQTG